MAFYGPLWGQSNGDDLTPLGTYLRNYLTPQGRDYAESNFLKVTPGDSTSYCNTCYALIGYLAEVVAGVPYATLTDSVLFRPLGMRDTHWFAKDFSGNGPATPYRFAADTGFVAAVPGIGVLHNEPIRPQVARFAVMTDQRGCGLLGV